MKRLSSLLILAAFASAQSLPAHALFGFGKKKGDDASEAAKDKAKALPGMEGTDDEKPRAAPLPNAPRMSEATATPTESPTAAAMGAVGAKGGSDGAPTSLPTEVVIRGGADAAKTSTLKPSLRIDSDPFESIRDSLKPDESLLLAESPLTITWRRTHPEFLQNARVVEPWRTTFSERQGIVFAPRDHLYEVLGRRVDPKEAKAFQWALTIADEEGRVFQHYEGSSNPPEELVWNGQNDQGEWLKAGRAYSPIYMFTDPGGSPHTKVGKTIQFTGIVHQEPAGLVVSLDSSVLFGGTKGAREIEKGGVGLVRSAADLIKRKYGGVPLRIEAFAGNKDLADVQAQAVQGFLMEELMLTPQNVAIAGGQGPFADQRVDIVLLNR